MFITAQINIERSQQSKIIMAVSTILFSISHRYRHLADAILDCIEMETAIHLAAPALNPAASKRAHPSSPFLAFSPSPASSPSPSSSGHRAAPPSIQPIHTTAGGRAAEGHALAPNCQWQYLAIPIRLFIGRYQVWIESIHYNHG